MANFQSADNVDRVLAASGTASSGTPHPRVAPDDPVPTALVKRRQSPALAVNGATVTAKGQTV
ncbi:hypothetical protein AB0O75_38815 [Streptomyces sp. NPDC088921]|uniref:hypothetical protein n=1 Tax=unclassified Streptomyces TaxID=2593676 RepID=UPI0034209D5C